MKKTIFTAVAAFAAVLALAQEPELVAYPAKGQAEAQQEKDRAECTQWSRKQSGNEGSSGNATRPAQAAASTPVRTAAPSMPMPLFPPFPGLPAPPRRPPAADAQASAAADGAAQQLDKSQRELQQRAVREGQHATSLRALAACLEGRGYVVK